MSFFDNFKRDIKSIIDKGKDALAYEATYTKPKKFVAPKYDVSQSVPNLTALRNTIQPKAPVKFGVDVKSAAPKVPTQTANSTQDVMLDRPTGGKLVIPSVIKGAMQGTARGVLATEFYALDRLTGESPEVAKKLEFVPTSWLSKKVFGEEPVSVKSEAIDPLIAMGASERAANKYGVPLLFALTAADFATGGGKKKLIQDALIGANDFKSANKVLKNYGIGDEAIRGLNLESKVVKIKTVEDAEKFVGEINKAIETSKKTLTFNGIKQRMTGSELDVAEKYSDFKAGLNLTGDFDERQLIADANTIAQKYDVKRDDLVEIISSGTDQPTPRPNRPGAQDITPPKKVETPKVKPESVSSDNLTTEAKKYKSADEFIDAVAPNARLLERGKYLDIWKKANPRKPKIVTSKKIDSTPPPDDSYRMSHRPTEGVRAFDLTEKIDGEQMIPKDMYTQWYGSRGTKADLESIAALKKIKGKPDADIIIYRASPKNEFNSGDWVTFSKSYATEHATGNNTKVWSKTVKAKDLKWAMDDVNEFGYYPAPKKKSILQTFKDMTPAERQGGYIGSKPKEFPKKVEPIDHLIAQNKVRVRMIDGKDTYEVKKGNTWTKVRDEDSAVKQATPQPKVIKPKQQLPDELENKLVAIDIQKEALAQDPASELGKYVAKRGEFKGRLPEEFKSKKSFGLDERVADAGFDTTEDARNAYDAYKARKAEILAEEKAVKAEVRDYKATAKLKEKTVIPAKAVDQVREIQKVSPEKVRSLEEAAQQMNEVLDLPPRQKPASLEKIVTQQTPVTKKVNLLDYIRTPDRVLNKIGFGKEARLLRNQYEKYVIELPKNMDVIDGWIKRVPGKESSVKIFDYLDGKPVQLTKAESEVAEEMREYLRNWADRLGLPEDNRVTNYITHLFDAELIAKEFDEDLAKIIADKIPGEVYNPFLQKRLGAKGYKRDVWGALDAYTKRATRKVHIDPVLERIREKAGSTLEFSNLEETQFKYIQEYINRVQMRPTYVDNLIDNGVKSLFGYRLGQRPVAAVSRTLRQFTYRGMLGANLGSALRNLSQGINTYAILGEKYTAIGYVKIFNTNARKELAEHGVLAANFIEDRTLSSTKKLLQKADKALWFFFDNAEKINRGATYFGAKAKGLNQGMTEVQAIEYAKKIVRKTQFAYDAVDAPVVLGSDLAKTLFQFQTFTTKQIEFLTELAKDKNYVGLIRYALAGYVFVNTVGQAMGMDEKELLPFYRFGVPPSLKLPAEVVKAAVDAPDKYGNVPDTEQKLKNIGKSTFGLIPGGIQAKKTYEGTQAVKEGGVFDKGGRQQFEQKDTTPAKLQSILFGKYASKEAKDYFDKETNTGNKTLDKALEEEKKINAETNKRVTTLTTEIAKLPPEEGVAQLKELAKTDKELAIKVRDRLREQKKRESWTKEDEGIAKLGVSNGARAKYVYEKGLSMGKEEGTAYVRGLIEKGVLSKQVVDQMKELKAGGSVTEKVTKDERTAIETVGAYASAFLIDPKNAAKALFTKEELGKVEGNLVELKRFYGRDYRATDGSEAYIYEQLKQMGIPKSERKNYNLEHIVPVSAGGDSSPENLRIVTREVHNSYTPVDTALGKAVKAGTLTRKEASKLAKDFKNGIITEEQVYESIK